VERVQKLVGPTGLCDERVRARSKSIVTPIDCQAVTTTRTLGHRRLISAVAAMPSRCGMHPSRITMSGASCSILSDGLLTV